MLVAGGGVVEFGVTRDRMLITMTMAPQLDPPTFQVVLAGVILQQGQAILVRMRDRPWRIPEVPLLDGEVPEDSLVNGLYSRLGWRIEPVKTLECAVRRDEGRQTVVITYGCRFDSDRPAIMTDGLELLRCWRHELGDANLPDPRLVESWLNEAG